MICVPSLGAMNRLQSAHHVATIDMTVQCHPQISNYMPTHIDGRTSTLHTQKFHLIERQIAFGGFDVTPSRATAVHRRPKTFLISQHNVCAERGARYQFQRVRRARTVRPCSRTDKECQ